MKMSFLIWIFIFAASSCNASSATDKPSVIKREIDNSFFPNWVPFKNKHGDELGEFIDVNKPKPKKRLALPANFILKAIEPEGDDYYDKSQGDSGDYYEKKEWSNLNRPANNVDPKEAVNPAKLNISDIDGIVNIITTPSDSPILKALNRRQPNKQKSKRIKIKSERRSRDNSENLESPQLNDDNDEDEPKYIDNTKKIDDEKDNVDESDEGSESESKEKHETHKTNKESKVDDIEKDDSDDDEESVEKQKEEAVKTEEQRKNEAKKAKILSSVDELKQRHAKEQQSISEKIKEEEIFKDDLERELERTGNKREEDYDKYAHTGSKWKKLTDADSSEEDEEPVYKNKYEIRPYKSITTTTTTTTTTSPRKRVQQTPRRSQAVSTGKLSVFRNPNLYTVSDEEYETTTAKTNKNASDTSQRFSSKYSSSDEDSVKISLVPADDSKEGEPTLFYAKKRPNKRKFKIKTTPIPDATADSSQETSSLAEVKISSASVEVSPTGSESSETAPSGTGAAVTTPSDTFSSASNTASGDVQVLDVTAASTSDSAQASTKKKEKKKDEDFHRETG